jgi:DNA mismatch endonuclease (patch repair protein)
VADVFTPKKRSYIMSRIRGRGNALTELVVLRLLKARGVVGWRRHYRAPGKPDFAFPGAKLAVFVDGCFWHGCPRCRRIPKDNADFWLAKFAANRRRDRRVDGELRLRRWSVIRIRQCELKRPDAPVARIVRRLTERAGGVSRGRVGSERG